MKTTLLVSNMLSDFRREWNGVRNNPFGKMRLLKEMSSVVVHYKNSIPLSRKRASFNKLKKMYRGMRLRQACQVCGKPADVRHHVIQLKNGGINGKRNLVSLCNDCHAEIHPHLKVAAA